VLRHGTVVTTEGESYTDTQACLELGDFMQTTVPHPASGDMGASFAGGDMLGGPCCSEPEGGTAGAGTGADGTGCICGGRGCGGAEPG
jgi:hypothetical protein